MKTFQFKLLLALLMLCAGFAVAGEKVVERYNATLANMGGAGRGPIPINILIYGYTSEEEVAKLAETLKMGGQDKLVDALDKMEMGRISPVGKLGNDLNYVRSIKTDKGRILRLVSNRPMSFLEVRNAGRSTDYPFGILELVIGDDGTIEGSVIGAAKIKINKDNVLEVESYGTEPLRLMSVKKTD